MLVISLLAGLLSSMNIWTISKSHMRLHMNDLYMALLMTAWMVTLHNIQMNNLTNVFIGFVAVCVITFLIRRQYLVTEDQYIKGMIPHHSMAILMSEEIKNKTSNPKIIDLANRIISSQTKEIKEMEELERLGV